MIECSLADITNSISQKWVDYVSDYKCDTHVYKKVVSFSMSQ